MSIEIYCTRKQAGTLHYLIQTGLSHAKDKQLRKITNLGKGKEDSNINFHFTDEISVEEENKEKKDEEEKMNNMVIGVGNCGTQIIKTLAKRPSVTKENTITLYSIDSTMTSVELDTIESINFIPIISDEKCGSGRNRERGKAMYKFHEDNHEFDEMYNYAASSKAPVVVVTSGAGGTGSGSIIPLCEALIDQDIQVIPIIICPNMGDPDAYHLNTNDLLLDLDELGITTYATFRNPKGDANYAPINDQVAEAIEIILGKKYDATTLDSIDDSDLDTLLNTPGRFVAVDVTAEDIPSLKKELTRRIFSGYQPAWSEEEARQHTFMTAFSLTSMFAKQGFATVFEEVKNRITNVFDEYRNIKDSDEPAHATAIIAGLPRPEIKMIDSEYKEADSIGNNINRSKRPNFMNRKKAVITKDDKGSVLKKFDWK